jgi:hypothetical protein
MTVNSLVDNLLLPINRDNLVLSLYNDSILFKWHLSGKSKMTHFALSEIIPDHTQRIANHYMTNSIIHFKVKDEHHSVPTRILNKNRTYYLYLGLFGENSNNDFIFSKKTALNSRIAWSSSYKDYIKTK